MGKRSELQQALEKINAEIQALQQTRDRMLQYWKPARERKAKPKAEPPRAVPEHKAS